MGLNLSTVHKHYVPQQRLLTLFLDGMWASVWSIDDESKLSTDATYIGSVRACAADASSHLAQQHYHFSIRFEWCQCDIHTRDNGDKLGAYWIFINSLLLTFLAFPSIRNSLPQEGIQNATEKTLVWTGIFFPLAKKKEDISQANKNNGVG